MAAVLHNDTVNLILEDLDNLQEKSPEWSDGLVKALTYHRIVLSDLKVLTDRYGDMLIENNFRRTLIDCHYLVGKRNQPSRIKKPFFRRPSENKDYAHLRDQLMRETHIVSSSDETTGPPLHPL